jgi:hypothetical protein
MNDYAWVLLKNNQPREAATVTTNGLVYSPNNPWLLSTNATALYESGDVAQARIQIAAASTAVQGLSDSEWAHAYPGNDPRVAGEGVAAFQNAIAANMKLIDSATTSKNF